MFKLVLRWLIPLLVIAAFAVAYVVTPAFHSHAANTTPSGPVSGPDIIWNPK